MLAALFVLAADAAPRSPSALASEGVDTGFDALRPDLPDCEDDWPYRLVQLPARPGLYTRWDKARSWGTSALVDAIVEVGTNLAVDHPEADPLFVGDLSMSRGGALPPHRSHDDGRSADIGLYAIGGVQPVSGFVPLGPEQLDVALTWSAMEKFLATDQVHHILLDQTLIDALREFVSEDLGMTSAEVDRIFPTGPPNTWSSRTGVVRPAPHHADHFHVRFLCQ